MLLRYLKVKAAYYLLLDEQLSIVKYVLITFSRNNDVGYLFTTHF